MYLHCRVPKIYSLATFCKVQIFSKTKFCMSIDLAMGYVSSLSVANVVSLFSKVSIEYEVIDTSYHRCPDSFYKESNCPGQGILAILSHQIHWLSTTRPRLNPSNFHYQYIQGRINHSNQKSSRHDSFPHSTSVVKDGIILFTHWTKNLARTMPMKGIDKLTPISLSWAFQNTWAQQQWTLNFLRYSLQFLRSDGLLASPNVSIILGSTCFLIQLS